MTTPDPAEPAEPPAARPHAMVLGVGPGLGASLARMYAAHGHQVTVMARRPESVNPVVEQIEAMGGLATAQTVDLADLDAVTEAIQAASARAPIAVLHHNASMHAGRLLDASPSALRDSVTVSVLAAIAAVRAARADLAATGGLVCWTGGGIALNPTADYGVLALGKAGLRAAAVAVAAELAEQGVRLRMVTVRGFIRPGTPVDPDLVAEAFWRHATDPDAPVELLFDGR